MDDLLARLAERQHGVFTLAQLRQLGFTDAAIRHRVGTGRWGPLGHCTFCLSGTPRSWERQMLAAVLAAGPGAVASHRSAAALLGVPGFGRRHIEVTTLRSKRHRDLRTIVHQSLQLPPHHVTSIEHIPVTRAARTLVDLAGALPPARTERAIDNCLSAGIVGLTALHEAFAELRRPGRHGIALLDRLLEDRSDGYVAPASELERRFLALLRAAGLKEPVRQHDVGDRDGWAGRVDYAYLDLRLLVEIDGRRHHMSKLDFEADRARDNRRVAAGWRSVRFTWNQVTRRQTEVIDVLLRSGVRKRRPDDAQCRKVG